MKVIDALHTGSTMPFTRKTLWALIVMAVVTLGLPLPAAASPSAPPPSTPPHATDSATLAVSGPWKIFPRGAPGIWVHGQCVEVIGGYTDPGAQVQIFPCGSPIPAHRKWSMTTIPGSTVWWRIYNGYSFKCMDVTNATAGSKVVQNTCSDSDTSNHWALTLVNTHGSEYDGYLIRNRYSGLCIRLDAANTNNGNDLEQNTCDTDSDDEIFTSWSWRPA